VSGEYRLIGSSSGSSYYSADPDLMVYTSETSTMTYAVNTDNGDFDQVLYMQAGSTYYFEMYDSSSYGRYFYFSVQTVDSAN
jgi:hypothetical protein